MGESSIHHVTCGLLIRAGRVFLVHRSPSKTWYPNVWDLPGGHLEPGENSRQALVRELREELSVEIIPPVGMPLLTSQDAEMLLDVWRVEEWNGDIVNAAPDEHDDCGWFSLEETRALDLADGDYPALFTRVLS